MSKTVLLTQVNITQISVDYIRNVVVAKFQVQDATGSVWESKEASFWVTLPPQTPIYDDAGNVTGYQPYPDTWFQLPSSYVSPLLSMKADAQAALEGKFLV